MNRRELTALSEAHIKKLLRAHLAGDVPVYLFGSRARRDGRWNSDYDLWIGADLPPTIVADIVETLEESFVSIRVDLIAARKLTGRSGIV